jgi:hypothetical protein
MNIPHANSFSPKGTHSGPQGRNGAQGQASRANLGLQDGAGPSGNREPQPSHGADSDSLDMITVLCRFLRDLFR